MSKKRLEEQTVARINKLNKDNHKERERILAEHEAQMKKMTNQVDKLHKQMQEDAEKNNQLRKIIEKKNYEERHPIPDFLKEKFTANPESVFIQLLGSRGSGKSTFLNKLLKKALISDRAKTGVNETTMKTEFFDVTEAVKNKPRRYNKVFLCDQPGIGGLKINEAKYLHKFGPGEIFNCILKFSLTCLSEYSTRLIRFNTNQPLACRT